MMIIISNLTLKSLNLFPIENVSERIAPPNVAFPINEENEALQKKLKILLLLLLK